MATNSYCILLLGKSVFQPENVRTQMILQALGDVERDCGLFVSSLGVRSNQTSLFLCFAVFSFPDNKIEA